MRPLRRLLTVFGTVLVLAGVLFGATNALARTPVNPGGAGPSLLPAPRHRARRSW